MSENEKYTAICFLHGSIFSAQWFAMKGWELGLVALMVFYVFMACMFILKEWKARNS